MRATNRIRRARRAQRGAAMVEAVVAIPFFILIFSGFIYAANLYGEKQRTLREAKQQSWTHALANCKSSAATTAGEGNPMNEMNSQGAGTDPSVNKYAGSSGGGELTRDWGTAVATVKGEVIADPVLGGFKNQLSTTTRMQCNEEPQEGNVLGVLKFGWSMAKFW